MNPLAPFIAWVRARRLARIAAQEERRRSVIIEQIARRKKSHRESKPLGWAYGSPGTQCAKRATERRDGRIVCCRHARATAPQYVGSETADQYDRFAAIAIALCKQDPRFAQMIADVAKEAAS